LPSIEICDQTLIYPLRLFSVVTYRGRMRFAVRHHNASMPTLLVEVPAGLPESTVSVLSPIVRVPVVALAIGLTACATPPITQNDTRSGLVETEDAFAYPAPGGPTVKAVVQRSYSNAVEQEIVLETNASLPGQNMLRIQMFGPADTGRPNQGTLKEEFEPGRNVGAEMRKLFPGVAMRRSLAYVQNKYGPFGYALGRSGRDGCIYGWQRITSTGTTQVWVGNRGAIQIRLRLCEEGASDAELLGSMYDFTISSSFGVKNWNPYGEPAPVDPSFGRVSRPIFPHNVDGRTPAQASQPPTTQRRAAATVQTVPQPQVQGGAIGAQGTYIAAPGGFVPAPVTMPPSGQMVPPPPDSRTAAPVSQRAAPVPVAVPAPAATAPANAVSVPAPAATIPGTTIIPGPVTTAPANAPMVPPPPGD
jgi:hypothetical protein